jgi:hypothetical protein
MQNKKDGRERLYGWIVLLAILGHFSGSLTNRGWWLDVGQSFLVPAVQESQFLLSEFFEAWSYGWVKCTSLHNTRVVW